MKRGRDSQKAKLYSAEKKIGYAEAKFMPELGDIQTYINRLVKLDWFRHHFPCVKTVVVKNGRKNAPAHGNPWRQTISMPHWSRNEMIILHEVAHVCGGTKPADGWHGPEFCRNFLILVWHMMGRDVCNRLWGSMRGHGVKIKDETELAHTLVGTAEASSSSKASSAISSGSAANAQMRTSAIPARLNEAPTL